MRVKINAGEISAKVSNILDEYNEEVQKETTKALKEVGKEGAKKLVGTSPTRTGKYASGWTLKTVKQSRLQTELVIHNKTKPGLAHLLEKPHQLRQGGYYQPTGKQIHIAPIDEWVANEAEIRVRRKLS